MSNLGVAKRVASKCLLGLSDTMGYMGSDPVNRPLLGTFLSTILNSI